MAKKYSNVIDLDSAKYVYDDSDMLHIPFEQRKVLKRKANPDWPNNYIKQIKQCKKDYDIILVWDREDIIKEYLNNNIGFMLCYPSKEDLKYYISRFKNRGNSEEYIEWKINQYGEKIKNFEELNVEKIVLTDNETLENYLIKNKYKLVKML